MLGPILVLFGGFAIILIMIASSSNFKKRK